MTTPQNQKLPQPGEWWVYHANPKCRRFVIGPNHQGNMVCVSERGEYEVFDEQGNMCVEFWHHLPDCDSFDWEPETWPKWVIGDKWIDNTAYIVRTSKTTMRLVRKDGSETDFDWSDSDDYYIASGIWRYATEAEAKARLTSPTTETWPKFIINPTGFDDDTVYLRRDSKDVTVRVSKDGTERINYWDANRDGFVRSGAWLQVTEGEAKSRLTPPQPKCPDCGEPASEGHAETCPEAWVTQDRVLDRPGVDEWRRSCPAWPEQHWSPSEDNDHDRFMHGDVNKKNGSVFEIRCRRKDLPPLPPLPAPVIDPGDGYRLIDPAVDVPMDGDEILDPVVGRWLPRPAINAAFVIGSTYRRKIAPTTKRIPLRLWVPDGVTLPQKHGWYSPLISRSDCESIPRGYIEVHGLNPYIEITEPQSVKSRSSQITIDESGSHLPKTGSY